jgi:hypothetical protein
MKEDQPLPEATETSIDWRKMPRNRPDKDEKHLAYSILIANGVQKEKAATMLGYSAKTVRSIDRALVKKSLKLVLLSEQRIQKAHRVIDKCLAGKAFGGVEVIKDSTALRAAECILDRSDPKAAQVSEPVYSFVEINIEEARFDFKLPPESPGEEPVPITLDAKPRTGEDP